MNFFEKTEGEFSHLIINLFSLVFIIVFDVTVTIVASYLPEQKFPRLRAFEEEHFPSSEISVAENPESLKKQDTVSENRPLATTKSETQRDNRSAPWLSAIVQKTGQASKISVTVCHISQNCQNWQGDRILVSPASLAKLPIVIALMEKVTQEQIKLESPIFVDPGNYTEDGSDIQVGKSYPLGFIALRTINQSSNIAANQLIDYLGQDYINQVLRDQGYQSSYVGHKFIGDKTYPKHPGCCSNRLTTNEITKMMLQIYQRQHIGDQIIAKSLAFQTDRTFAYRVVKQQPIKWLGEKTGWHSKFLGTTVATKIGDDIYIMTVVINQGNQKSLVRQVIREIGQHLLNQGFMGIEEG